MKELGSNAAILNEVKQPGKKNVVLFCRLVLGLPFYQTSYA